MRQFCALCTTNDQLTMNSTEDYRTSLLAFKDFYACQANGTGDMDSILIVVNSKETDTG